MYKILKTRSSASETLIGCAMRRLCHSYYIAKLCWAQVGFVVCATADKVCMGRFQRLTMKACVQVLSRTLEMPTSLILAIVPEASSRMFWDLQSNQITCAAQDTSISDFLETLCRCTVYES